MSSAQSPKLTKKQKKGIAFRERKQGKSSKGKNDQPDGEGGGQDVPIQEAVDQAEIQNSDVEMEKAASTRSKETTNKKGNGKAVAVREDAKVVENAKKRKREEGEAHEGAHEGEKPKQKKVKRGSEDDAKAKKDSSNRGKQRFILFVGNLKYTTSQDAIKEHFAACDPPPTIRLLTPKPSAPGKPTAKSKGCAFLEFSHRNALQQALKLHQSEIEGRRINVELTAGGGGKSEQRLSRVKGRNKELDGQRKKRHEKQATAGKGDEQASMLPERPQRFSTTSGIEQNAAGKRTWTVGDEEDGTTHRGGQKHSKTGKKGRPKGKEWGTGVNAIPVG